jgi:hypothetical protein
MLSTTKAPISTLQSLIDLPWCAPLYGTLPAPMPRKS